jgi:hypothetical protein
MGRSNPDPSFLNPAGARFTVIRLAGNGKPLFTIADFTLAALSLTALSGRPTTVTAGNPL